MAPKITPVSIGVCGISYTPGNGILAELSGGEETLQFAPTDVLNMFHALLQALGVQNADNLYFAIEDALTGAPDDTAAANEAVTATITELAG